MAYDTSILSGFEFQFQVPGGEFNRSDPSSNIITGGLMTVGFKPWSGARNYATFYPVFGFEAGRNLNRPHEIDEVPVDLSNYKGIFRGVVGADAVFARTDEDNDGNVFSITGSYKVRLPATDEPFVKTEHQVTTISLTTKSRHLSGHPKPAI